MAPLDRLRFFTSENPAAYRLWFRWHCFKLRKKKQLPMPGDPLYFDGFPRSGNTYFTAGLKKVFSGLQFANHLHAVAPIRMALDAGVPAIVLMREPSESVASYVLHIQSPITQSSKKQRNEAELCELLLRQWRNYYRWVKRLEPQLKVVLSERAFSDPAGVAELVATETGLDVERSVIESRWHEFHQSFKEKDKTKRQGSTSFPSEARDRQKLRVSELISMSSRLAECKRLYEEISLTATLQERAP